MKPLCQLTKKDISKIKMICFDCDGVTVRRGTEISQKFDQGSNFLKVHTYIISEQMRDKINELKKYFHVSFSSGRSLSYLQMMYGEILWENSSLQGENGIFALVDGQVVQHKRYPLTVLEKIEDIRTEIRKLQKTNREILGFEPKQFLITIHCKKEIQEIYDIVHRIDSKNQFYVWWNYEAFDIGLKNINKGFGLKSLARYLKIEPSQVMAIGNGINDRDMVEAAGIGISTDPEVLETNFYTKDDLHLGGEELVDKLLQLVQK
jgi:HAD superfamily hydrolase (TIGR01484 family)